MKYFFWIAFAVFLAASIPHVAYFFASFEPSQGPEGVWWWAVSYAIAISMDVTVYLLSYTAFKRYRRFRTPKAVWQHWFLIVICTIFSWAVNWAYAKQFHSLTMLSSSESVAPWLTNIFPFMASAFPLLGIVYTMMAETISETEESPSFTLIADLIKHKQLSSASQPALTSGNATAVINEAAEESREANESEDQPFSRSNESRTTEELRKPITGQFVALENVHSETSGNTKSAKNNESGTDKLQLALEALHTNPDMTDEALAEYLSLKRSASARFWRLKAVEILNASMKEEGESKVPVRSAWVTTGVLTNGSVAKR